MEPKKGIVIFSEGKIGSGKTTVLKDIMEMLKCRGEDVVMASGIGPITMETLKNNHDYIIIDEHAR